MNVLSKILSSKIRSEIFCLLFGISNQELHMREIERRTGYAIGTIQAELKKLSGLDLILKRKDGNRLYYRANQEHPLYPEIRSLVLKTDGLVNIFQAALVHNSKIFIAFVFGSVARHDENAKSDVDLMVIGDIGLRQLSKILSHTPEQIGREINPHILSIKEFKKRITNQDHFITQIIKEPKIFIKGNEDELRAMVE